MAMQFRATYAGRNLNGIGSCASTQQMLVRQFILNISVAPDT
jgi:hypothetical protein